MAEGRINPEPPGSWGTICRGFCWAFATGAGTGLIPKIPGTAGSLLALAFFICLPYPGNTYYLLVVLILFIIGIPLCTWAERRSGKQDDQRIVWDEMVGMWVALYALPPSVHFYLLAFAFFRFFDIWKPFGESGQRGFGIMLDDLLAGVCANICLQVPLWLIGALL